MEERAGIEGREVEPTSVLQEYARFFRDAAEWNGLMPTKPINWWLLGIVAGSVPASVVYFLLFWITGSGKSETAWISFIQWLTILGIAAWIVNAIFDPGPDGSPRSALMDGIRASTSLPMALVTASSIVFISWLIIGDRVERLFKERPWRALTDSRRRSLFLATTLSNLAAMSIPQRHRSRYKAEFEADLAWFHYKQQPLLKVSARTALSAIRTGCILYGHALKMRFRYVSFPFSGWLGQHRRVAVGVATTSVTFSTILLGWLTQSSLPSWRVIGYAGATSLLAGLISAWQAGTDNQRRATRPKHRRRSSDRRSP